MINFVEGVYKIAFTTDIEEWAREFYQMPDGAEILNLHEVTNSCMRFASPTENQIWIFIPEDYKLQDLKETVSHEIGHIVTGGFKKNPAERMIGLHEKKAIHYENFYMTVDAIVEEIVKK